MELDDWTSDDASSEEDHELDELNVTRAHGFVWFWISGTWRSVRKERWAWRLLTTTDDDGRRRWLWVPRLLSTDVEGYSPEPKRLPLARPPYDTQSRHACSAETAAPLVFEFICTTDLSMESYCWTMPWDDTPSYPHRALARTCRLVCRDWARQLPLGDPCLTVTDGVVWYCADGEWQVLPRTCWAWTFQRIEWWVERSEQDHVRGRYRDMCGAWYPRLTKPFNNSVRSKGKDRSMMLSPSMSSEQLCTRSESFFGTCFRDHACDVDTSRLSKICKLVCREWARRFPIHRPGQDTSQIRKAIMQHWLDEQWCFLPDKYWRWFFKDVMWSERCCQDFPRCAQTGCRNKGWRLKLVQYADDLIRRNPEYSLSLGRSLKYEPLSLPPAFTLPTELFKYVCNAADSQSWSCRLVCRYWNAQCTPHIFERLSVQETPARIRALWRVRAHPTFVQHVKLVAEVPGYSGVSSFPWIHFLTQFCDSTQSVWRDAQGATASIDFFPMTSSRAIRAPTVRSIHYALPRSLPRSFSRGIRCLLLGRVKFRRLEDLTHTVCELPDLEVLSCSSMLGSLPTSLPRRRPRRSRNKLKQLGLKSVTTEADAEPALAALVFTALGLFLGVYDVAYFFSDHEVAVILAAFSLIDPLLPNDLTWAYDTEGHTRQLEFSIWGSPWSTRFRFKSSSADNTRSPLRCYIGLYFHAKSRPGDNLSAWKDFDHKFGGLFPNPLVSSVQVVLGFRLREDMIGFAKNVLGKMPSLSALATIRYSIDSVPQRAVISRRPHSWRQASLDWDELRGKPKEDLLDVYP